MRNCENKLIVAQIERINGCYKWVKDIVRQFKQSKVNIVPYSNNSIIEALRNSCKESYEITKEILLDTNCDENDLGNFICCKEEYLVFVENIYILTNIEQEIGIDMFSACITGIEYDKKIVEQSKKIHFLGECVIKSLSLIGHTRFTKAIRYEKEAYKLLSEFLYTQSLTNLEKARKEWQSI